MPGLAIVIDEMNFRRARVESFFAAWAKYENVDLISIAPAEAREKLGGDMDCRLLIYSAGGTPSSSVQVLTELHELHTLRPAAALVIVADDGSLDGISAAVNAGAQGYLDNAMEPALALRVLSFVLHGGTYVPHTAILAGQAGAVPPHHCNEEGGAAESDHDRFETKTQAFTLIGSQHDGAKKMQPQLTARQQAVISCLCVGDSNKAIANKLGMTETAVKVHVREIMRKLGVFNRTQVALVAARHGLAILPCDHQLLEGVVPSVRPH